MTQPSSTAEPSISETSTSEGPESPPGLKGKSILFVNSGFLRKRFILQRARQLGVKIILLNRDSNWASRYTDHIILSDTYNQRESLARVLEFVKSGPLDGVVTFWEDDIPLAARISESLKLAGNPIRAALAARNKLRTRKVLENRGLSRYCPPFAPLNSVRELEQTASTIKFPLILKPVWGASSQFVIRADSLDEAKNALEYMQANLTPAFDPIYSYGTEIMAEGYLDGAEVDIDMLLQDGEIKFHSFTDNFPTREPFFVETGDAMPSRHENPDLENVLKMGREVVKALGLRSGAVHLEAKILPEGPKLVEVNARMGGDYVYDWVKRAWGVDLVEETLKIATGIPCNPPKSPEPLCHLVGKYLIPSSSGVISQISSSNGKNGTNGKNGKEHEITILKEVGETVMVPPEGYEAIGWVIGKGHTYAEAEENLEQAFRSVNVTIARFDSTSSIGKTRRRNRFSYASIARRRIIQDARLERIRRHVNPRSPSPLHVGVLCNRFAESSSTDGQDNGKGAQGAPPDSSLVHQDLESVGMNIQKGLEAKGHKVSFFDMNETPLPFQRMSEANVDIVFNVCERINNSSLLEPHAAGVLDCLGIPYTGSNPLTLALCIDKIKVKKLLQYHDIPTPRFDYVFNPTDLVREDLNFPLMVKPANTDNSIGITNDSVVTSPRALKERIEFLFSQLNRPVLIEEYIEGDEVDVSILGNEENVKVLPLSRSMFEDMPEGYWHIYPFKAKWTQDPVYDKIRSERPARYSQKLTQLISEIALDVYNLLDCHDYARIEVRVTKDGNPYVLECNPNPSINSGDCIPACAELIGLDYEAFIEAILSSAISRYQAHPPYYHLQSSLLVL